jgi:hypothetical protein
MTDKSLFIGALAMIGASSAAIAGPAPQISWGRAGVTFAQYRTDAIACGRLGANTDISRESATQDFVAAERWRDRNLNMPLAGADVAREQAQMIQRLGPERKLKELQQVHLGAVETCLSQLGYQRFALTREQAKALRALPSGSAARHTYLHRLGSDAVILSKQAVRTSDAR